MADNYLERQYEEYQQRKVAAEKTKRLQWQKRLKAYKEKISSQQRKPDI